MGAGQSKSERDDRAHEKVFRNETSISFSQDVVNQLADRLESPETSPERQSTLDAIVRSRIHSELERLKQQEEIVRQQIENALEKENLDRERNVTEGEPEASDDLRGNFVSSAVLMGDLEEIQNRVDKYHGRRGLAEIPEVKLAGEAVVSCYKNNPSTLLDCWREVEEFKLAVTELEVQYCKSLQ